MQTDFTTEGNWKGVYGADGYSLVGNTSSYPAYATVAPSGNLNWTWTPATQDKRALQSAAGTNRVAAAWYTPNLTSGNSFSVDVNLTDGHAHGIAVYALDWDGFGPRSEIVSVLDASSGAILDSRSVSTFEGGAYLVWNVTGHVTIRVSNSQDATNAVISGLFFGPVQSTPAAGASVSFLNTDTTTQGSWIGT